MRKFDATRIVWERLFGRGMTWSKPVDPSRNAARSIYIRHVDCGSSNAAELEVLALFNPVYNLEQYGFRLVTSPRHADLLLLTGPLTRAMQEPLLAAFHAMPIPRRVITIGDGFDANVSLGLSYAVVPLPEEIRQAQIAAVPGDPPSPRAILQTLLALRFP